MLKFLKYPFMLLGVIFAFLLVFTTWYTVGESQQAVVMTGGKVTQVVTASGLKFKLPYPVSSVKKVSKETFGLTFGYTEGKDGKVVNENVADAKMITGDENIVLADMVVQWKITDPAKYLFASDEPESILFDASSSSLRAVIGTSKIDDALTTGKIEIESKVRESLAKMIKDYDIGIGIVSVQLQDVQPPTKEVQKSFTSVTDAREMMNTKVNQAEKYKNQKLNEVKGEVEAQISAAEADKTARIEKAKGDVALYDSLFKAYKLNPEVTKERLILEALDTVLPQAKVYITDGAGGTVKYLPIDQVNQKATK